MAEMEPADQKWFESAILDKVIDQARIQFGNNWELLPDGENMLKRLEAARPQMQSLIALAKMRTIATDDSLEYWMRLLKDVVYEADDVLDGLESEFATSSESTIESRFEHILKKIDVIAAGVTNFIQVLDVPKIMEAAQETRETSSLFLDGKFFGRNHETDAILGLLLPSSGDIPVELGASGNLSLKVIPILGVGGVGKTALAQQVYRHVDKTKKYEVMVWVSLHDKMGVKEIAEHMVQNLQVQMLSTIPNVVEWEGLLSSYNHRTNTSLINKGEPRVPPRFINKLLKKQVQAKTYNHQHKPDIIPKTGHETNNQQQHGKRSTQRESIVIPPVDKSFGPSQNRTDTLEGNQKALEDLLARKRFLIVFDNLWDEMGIIWEQLHTILINGAKESAVLVTTQSQMTAEKIGTPGFGPVLLDFLGEDDFQGLFEYYAFGDKKKILGENLKELQSIGRQITRKLHGLPLAGKVMGSLLQSNLDAGYWNGVLKSEWWELDFCLKGILPSLGQSFQHLSSNLKQCFAYCSILPKGHRFHKDKLVHMWMAQGFIQPKEGELRRMEDIGSEWFDELVNKSFFQLMLGRTEDIGSERFDELVNKPLFQIMLGRMEDNGSEWFDELENKSFFQRTVRLPERNKKFVKINKLMQELAICVSMKECFVLQDDSIGTPQGICHLSVRNNRPDVLFAEPCKLKGLRTISYSYRYHFEEYNSDLHKNPSEALGRLCEQSKSLRVLDLYCNQIVNESSLNAIGGLSHLRYLDLSYTKLRHLPETICGLFNLQVLNLEGCLFDSLPKGICNLVKIRHLYARRETLGLISNIGKLSNLQELKGFSIGSKTGHQMVELEHMRELRELEIEGLENVETKEEALKAMLLDKEYLQSLKLLWSERDLSRKYVKEEFEGLQPHRNLKELVISGHRGITSPTWMEHDHRLPNLQVVRLSDCCYWSRLPSLGHLQFLKVLCVESMSCIKLIDKNFYGNNEVAFPSLEELVLSQMGSLKKWSGVKKGLLLFPHLRKIHLKDCSELRKFPFLSVESSSVEEVVVIRGHDDLGIAFSHFLQSQKSLKILELTGNMGSSYLDLQSLTTLQHLCLHGNERPRLHSLPQGLPSLTHLEINAASLKDEMWLNKFGSLLTLKVLRVTNYCSYEFKAEEERWLQDLTSLQELTFRKCARLLCLPSFSSGLRRLSVYDCPLLLFDVPLPTSIKELCVGRCLKLKEQCQKNVGSDRINISHIPYIAIDGNVIQRL